MNLESLFAILSIVQTQRKLHRKEPGGKNAIPKPWKPFSRPWNVFNSRQGKMTEIRKQPRKSGQTRTVILYQSILARLFNNTAGGRLVLDRIKGESGEIALLVGTSKTPFGLINVGNTQGLCDHIAEVSAQSGTNLEVENSDFTETMFTTVKDSTSPTNVPIGSQKFVEGWDFWRPQKPAH